MRPIELLAAMHLKSEQEPFYLLRENGQAAFNFVHFLSPVAVVLDGEAIITEKNACIIYSPHFRQEYYALPNGFINNFITFTTEDPRFVSRYGLPVNTVFYVNDGEFITKAAEYISWAFIDCQEDHSVDLVEHIYQFMHDLSRQQIIDSPKNQRLHQTKQRFIQLRETVRLSPKDWTVERMAKAVYLTRSRFYVLYRALFNVTPSEDLINMTLEYAKHMLLMSEISIYQIAKASGYESVEHFIRLFRKKEGVTPGQYRKQNNITEKP